MNKKLMILVIVLTLALVVSGCGQKAPEVTSNDPGQQEQAQTETSEGDKYPSRTIEYIIGFGAGGGTDVFGRTINIPVRKAMNAQIVEINLPGGASLNAMSQVLTEPADGYTLFGVTSDIYPGLVMGRSKHSYTDLTPIICAHVDPGAIETKVGAPYKTWEEFVDYAKANPGKISWGGTGSASFDEVVSAHTWMQAGLEVKYIPFESASEMHAALLGGHIDVMYEEPGVVMEMVKAGQIQPLLTLTEERLSILPDTTASGEIGYEPAPMIRRGVAVKKGTPDDIVKALEKAYTDALQDSIYTNYAKERMLDLYPGYLNSEDFTKVMDEEYKVYEKILKDLGHVK